MTQSADVFFHVQHLLGIGHLRRAATIARALDHAGMKVVFVSGGFPVPDLDIANARLAQLPPLRSRDEAFSALVGEDGREIDEAWKAARAEALLRLYEEADPRVLLIEMFPFGRRQLRFELIPLLDAATARRPRPMVVTSLRDIVNRQSKPEKIAWILQTARRYIDRVLVHGAQDFVPLERSFPEAAEIAEKISYTGYVVADAPRGALAAGPGTDRGEVIVSTGGGAVAAHLIEAALAARPLTALKSTPWRILVGHNLAERQLRHFAETAPRGVVVERSRTDFPRLLARAALSISQAGYNTVMEVLQAGCPAVVVPFAAGAETEQSLRAELLAARGALAVVDEAGLTGESLARGIAQALATRDAPRDDPRGAQGFPAVALSVDGAAKTAEIIARMLATVSS